MSPPASDEVFFALATDLLAIVDDRRRFVRVNPAWTRVLGWAEQDLIGSSVRMVLHLDDLAAAQAAFDALPAAGTVTGTELRLVSVTGATHLFEWNLAWSSDDGRLQAVGRDVTERRREARLLRQIEDTTRVGSFEIDLDTDRVRWSRVTHEIYGTDPAAGDPDMAKALACYPPEALAVLEPAVTALVAHGEPYDLTTPFVSLRGERRWVRARAEAELRDGQVFAVSGTFEDVTEAREERQRLERLAAMVELGRDGVWELTPDGVTSYANPRLAELLGTTVAELAGVAAVDLADPDHRATVAGFLAALPGGSQAVPEVLLRPCEGRPVWVSLAGRARVVEGRVAALIVMVSDLTVLKSHQEQLRRSEARLRSFVELAPLGIVRHDMQTQRVLDANRAACELAGLAPRELVGRSYAELIELPPERDAAASVAVAQTGRFGPIEAATVRADGHRLTLEVTGVALPAEAGGFEVWSLIRDVTEPRRVEQLKDEFVATVSHELRTPLTSIAGALELLAGTRALSDDQRSQLMDVAARNAGRLGQLIDDILDLASLDTAEPIGQFAHHDLVAVVRDAIAAASGSAAAAEVGLVLLPPVVPAGGAADGTARTQPTSPPDPVGERQHLPVPVLIDEPRLQRALGNLLANAVRFSAAGQDVEVAVHTTEGSAEVRVRDHGPGVPDDFVPRLFDRFAQADASDRRQAGGTGLGLSIAKAVIERQGGRIDHESPSDGGACFVIQLPLVAGATTVTAPGGAAR